MTFLTKVLNGILDAGYRMIKIIRMGDADVQTADEASPAGMDSCPISDMVAVFSETSVKGEPVIVGYLNKNQLAKEGEVRFYSTDTNGGQKFYTWLKNDGTYEIGGNDHNLVRFTPLNQGLQSLVDFINMQLPMIAAGISTGGGSYTPGTAELNIDASKIDEIKTL